MMLWQSLLSVLPVSGSSMPSSLSAPDCSLLALWLVHPGLSKNQQKQPNSSCEIVPHSNEQEILLCLVVMKGTCFWFKNHVVTNTCSRLRKPIVTCCIFLDITKNLNINQAGCFFVTQLPLTQKIKCVALLTGY